jgi:hypothetical protein
MVVPAGPLLLMTDAFRIGHTARDLLGMTETNPVSITLPYPPFPSPLDVSINDVNCDFKRFSTYSIYCFILDGTFERDCLCELHTIGRKLRVEPMGGLRPGWLPSWIRH